MKELSPCSRSFDFKVLMMSHPPPPIFFYLGIKTELVTVGTDATVGIRMSGFFLPEAKNHTNCRYRNTLYILYTVYSIPLNSLRLLRARFLCQESYHFRINVVAF